MISRNTGRTASRGKAPFAAAVSRSSTARSRPGTWNVSRRLRLISPDLLDHLGAPIEQRQDLVVQAVDLDTQLGEARSGTGSRLSR